MTWTQDPKTVDGGVTMAHKLDIACPACQDPMAPQNVTCWTCYRLSDRLTPGTHQDPENGYPFTCLASDIAKWDRARDARAR